MVTKLTNESFENEALNSDIPVLVDFYADWCGPCKMLAPAVERISERYAGKVKVCKVNVDEAYPVAATFGIQSIPTLIVFRDGEIKEKSIGLVSENELAAMIDRALG
ncbi:MAG: thioredoxin [Clostridia bacterium]|nr:thioredoxin [Clostridia bacterium]